MKVNVTIEIRSLVSEAPETFRVSNAVASGGLHWQYIVNCHIFKLYIVCNCTVKTSKLLKRDIF